MEPTGLRDVFKCFTLSFAAMEDIGLAPKATNDPVHRPTVTETFGMHQVQDEHAPLRHIHSSDTNRKFDLEKDGPSRKKSNSVIAEPLMVPMCPPPHNPVPSVTTGGMSQDAHHHAADKNGNTAVRKAGPAKKKCKARVAEPSNWKQNKQKQLRMEGKSYISKRKKDGQAVTKKPRTIGPRCTSSACKRASNRFCNDIGDEGRKRLFDDFWQRMNWAQRRVYVAGLVDRDPVERNRGAAGAQSRRTVSLRYHLRIDGKRKQVCKNTFLTTLGIGEWSVLSWAQKTVASKGESNEKVAEKRPAVRCPEPDPPPPTATNAAEVDLDANQEEHSESDTEQQSTELENEGLSRKKSRVAKPQTWKQNKQKQLRMEGKPYVSRRKKDGTTVTKEPRKMGAGCKSNACKRASNRFCADVSENARKQLFDGFWQRMTWTQRKVYVAGLVDRDPVERTRAPWTQSRRTVSLRYHLMVDGERKQVCKRMFLSTLGVGEWSVLNWAQHAAAEQAEADEANAKKRSPRKSAKASEHVILKEYLESLPKVPSYYCGTSISKLFLEPVFSNMTEVYRQYKTHCLEKQTAPLSRQVFCAVFKKMDLGLCDPKKDQGCSYNTPATGNLFNELWEEYCMEREHPSARADKLGES